MKITSVQNDLVKETAKLLQKKYRDNTGLFLIEGEKGISEASKFGVKICKIFYSDEKYLCKKIPSEVELYEVNDAVMSKISETKTVPKVIAVAKQSEYEHDILKKAKKVVLIENVKDAGNLGTIIRTAVAFKIDAVVLYGDVADIYNPKCVRSTVGNLWKIPIFKIRDFKTVQKYFDNFERIATLPKGENVTDLKDYKPTENVLMMFGSEAEGLSNELKNYATKNVTIEMSENVESLNLAISAGVIMYHLM